MYILVSKSIFNKKKHEFLLSNKRNNLNKIYTRITYIDTYIGNLLIDYVLYYIYG